MKKTFVIVVTPLIENMLNKKTRPYEAKRAHEEK